jgi:hypothetical protein
MLSLEHSSLSNIFLNSVKSISFFNCYIHSLSLSLSLILLSMFSSRCKLRFVIFILYYCSLMKSVFISFYGILLNGSVCMSFFCIYGIRVTFKMPWWWNGFYILNHDRHISILFLFVVVPVAAQDDRYCMRKLDTFRYFFSFFSHLSQK